jgi:hypothetical protein
MDHPYQLDVDMIERWRRIEVALSRAMRTSKRTCSLDLKEQIAELRKAVESGNES